MNRFKELRKKNGFTSQSDLAKVLFVNQTAVSQWERGVTTPSNQMLIRLSELYGVTTDYLLGRDTPAEDKKKPTPEEGGQTVNGGEDLTEYLEALRARPECRMLFSLAKGATKEDVEKAVAIIEALRRAEGRG